MKSFNELFGGKKTKPKSTTKKKSRKELKIEIKFLTSMEVLAENVEELLGSLGWKISWGSGVLTDTHNKDLAVINDQLKKMHLTLTKMKDDL